MGTHVKLVPNIIPESFKLALKSCPPSAADHVYTPGDMVYVYREKLRHYTGPHMVASSDSKSVGLHVGETTAPRLFNKSQIRPSPLQNELDEEITGPNYHLMVLHTEVLGKGDPREKWFDEVKRN